VIEREPIGNAAAAIVAARRKCTWPSASITSIIAFAMARLV
jgi:hypothetical protein